MPSFFNFRGYVTPDPLDKAPKAAGYCIVAAVNILLSIGLLWFITHFKIVSFNGPGSSGFWATPPATEIIEVFINGFLYSVFVFALRKCSSVIPFLIILLPYFLLDLYIESHFRCAGCDHSKALWLYNPDSFVYKINIVPLRFLTTLSVDAFLFGVCSLWLSRLIATFFYRTKSDPLPPSHGQYFSLFRKEWTENALVKPKRDWAFWVLRLLGTGYAIYLSVLLLGLLGSGAWPKPVAELIDATYSNPALAINTFFKITLMVMLAFTGAYNKALRYYCTIGLFAGHMMSTAFSLSFHFLHLSGEFDTGFLLLSGILDGVMGILFFIIVLAYKKYSHEFDPEKDAPKDWSLALTAQEWLYRFLGFFFLLVVTAIILVRLLGKGHTGISAVFGYPDPLISNSITFYFTLSVLFLLQVKREQLRVFLFNPVVIPLLSVSILALLWLIVGGMGKGVWIETRHLVPASYPPVHTLTQADWYFVLEGLTGIIICFSLIGFRRLFYSGDYGLNALTPSAAINFLALAEALFDADVKERAQMLQSVDNYVGGIRGRKRGLLNIPFGIFENGLNFIYDLHPPFSSMSIEERRFYLSKYFLRNEWERRNAFVPPLADIAYQIGLALNSLVSFACFNHINAKNKIGYVPVNARDRTQGDCASGAPPFTAVAALPKDQDDPLNFKPTSSCDDGKQLAPRLTTPFKEEQIPDEVDYIIIGSGAGGATAAYRLACSVADPSRILIVESGSRYQPLQDFTDDEMSMFNKVYKEGGLQQTKKFTMTVLQGECVGGTTVINNAVCFKMPDKVRTDWTNNYGIDLSRINEKYNLIAGELNIKPLGDKGVNSAVRSVFTTAVSQYNLQLPAQDQLRLEDPVLVNHINNTGDGNWNIGNKRMQKRSMLETYIPWSEARGVKVISNTAAAGISKSKDGKRAEAVILRSASGHLTKVSVKKAVVVAAGAIASSHFLMRSGIGGENTGMGLSCNFAFPLTIDMGKKMNSFDGDQITMAALDPQGRAAFETYFNPPATFSIAGVPFFFDKRDAMMNEYTSLVNFGSLIGSEPNGKVLRRPTAIQGRAFDWALGQEDITRIRYSLETLVSLGALAGGKSAVLPFKPGLQINLQSKKDRLDFELALSNYPLRITDLSIGTAHPQGGNAMAGASSANGPGRVADENFCVRGLNNVFIADASLFPTSITVNPQWTVMAMSSLAADAILNLRE